VKRVLDGWWRASDREGNTHREDAPATVLPDGASAFYQGGEPVAREAPWPCALRPSGWRSVLPFQGIDALRPWPGWPG
jgi:hypothetical protein